MPTRLGLAIDRWEDVSSPMVDHVVLDIIDAANEVIESYVEIVDDLAGPIQFFTVLEQMESCGYLVDCINNANKSYSCVIYMKNSSDDQCDEWLNIFESEEWPTRWEAANEAWGWLWNNGERNI